MKNHLVTFFMIINNLFHLQNHRITHLINQMKAWLVCIINSNHVINRCCESKIVINFFPPILIHNNSRTNRVFSRSSSRYYAHSSLLTIASSACLRSLNLLRITTIKINQVSAITSNFKELNRLNMVNLIKWFIIKFLMTKVSPCISVIQLHSLYVSWLFINF